MRFSAVLLAGGKSSRMGRDKALIEIEGEPLWRRQLATLRHLQPEQLMVSGPRRICPGEHETIGDEMENAGPLGGIAAALRHCTAPLLIVLAVDLPRMTTTFLQDLIALSNEGRGVVPRRLDFFEPLAAVYSATSAELAAAHLRRGDFSMQNFVRAAIAEELVTTRAILPNEHSLFTNLNNPSDL